MTSIYSKAELVIAWLGPAYNDSDLAVEYISTVSNSSYSLSILFDQPLPRNRYAVREFFMRPYWCRLWIVQEITQSNKVTFVCGQKQLSKNVLQSFMNDQHYFYILSTKMGNDNFPPLVSRSVIALFQKPIAIRRRRILARSDYTDKIVLILPDTNMIPEALTREVYTYCDHQCVDARDKIYGVLGLVDNITDELKVDYKKSAAVVFWDFLQLSLLTIDPQNLESIWRHNGTEINIAMAELLDGWFHIMFRVLTHMDLLTSTLLEETAKELDRTLEKLSASILMSRLHEGDEFSRCRPLLGMDMYHAVQSEISRCIQNVKLGELDRGNPR